MSGHSGPPEGEVPVDPDDGRWNVTGMFRAFPDGTVKIR
jgi:hypothetical protein